MIKNKGRGRPKGTKSSLANKDPEHFWYLGQDIALKVGIFRKSIPVTAHPDGRLIKRQPVERIIRDAAKSSGVRERTAQRAYREFADCNQPMPSATKASRLWLEPEFPVRKSRVRRTLIRSA